MLRVLPLERTHTRNIKNAIIFASHLASVQEAPDVILARYFDNLVGKVHFVVKLTRWGGTVRRCVQNIRENVALKKLRRKVAEQRFGAVFEAYKREVATRMFKSQTLFDNVKQLCDKNIPDKLRYLKHDITHYDRDISPSKNINSARKTAKEIQ
jgi:hypothetical protein